MVIDPELEPSLIRLDVRLRSLVDAYRSELTERARDPFLGLYITEPEVDELLGHLAVQSPDGHVLSEPAAVTSPRMAGLAAMFDLDAFEQEALLVCVAPDLDLRYERLYGYLQDDVTRRRPGVDLLLRLLCSSFDERARARAALGASGRLMRSGLVGYANEDAAGQMSMLARPLRVDERIIDYLLGFNRLDPRVETVGKLIRYDPAEPSAWDVESLAGLVRLLRSRSPVPVTYLHGAAGSGRRTTAQAACAAAGRNVLLINLPHVLATTNERTLPPTLVAIAREALLQDAVLVVDDLDALIADESEHAVAQTQLRRVLSEHRGPVLLLGGRRFEPALWLPGVAAVRVELPLLSIAERTHLWQRHLNGQLSAAERGDLAVRYRLVDDESIRAVKNDAVGRAALRRDSRVGVEDVRLAARSIATPPLDGLARHISPRYRWDDIVLSADNTAQLQEVCDRLRFRGTVLEQWGYGRKHARREGITALFAGPPGTGKTMAAEIIASELGLDLYRIDLSAVVSKYIGETEKNLERIFSAADQGEAVLLFDEADAIFGKRSEVRDARDRYANVEVAYLLQRLEAYDGLAVLTTNLRGNIDEAFIRRLDCVLEFPLPDEAERLRIWRLALPSEAPLADDVDLTFLARKFKLPGGHIRNTALTAGFLAATDGGKIGMRHLARAIRREYQKLSKLVAENDFEHYFALLKD